jgi:hypothetical protein
MIGTMNKIEWTEIQTAFFTKEKPQPHFLLDSEIGLTYTY